MTSGIPLTSDERESRIANLCRLLGSYFEKLTQNNLELLQGAPIETVNAAYAKLISFGIEPEKIASNAQLLGMDPETLHRHWQNLRRYFAADTIRENPALLGRSSNTVAANVQFLAAYRIPTDMPLLYYASPQLKREKMVWIAKNVFNTHMLNEYERREAISKIRQLVSKHPIETICPSVKQLEKNISKLKKLAESI
ncbi:MAG: hypothetical protein QXW80_00405 [Candidatus Micrarchaeia archaeon]